jgi:hypothetical protein
VEASVSLARIGLQDVITVNFSATMDWNTVDINTLFEKNI